MSGAAENAASSVSTLSAVYAMLDRYAEVRPRQMAESALRVLGIDPDMPVETLKRRLLWGERVEEGNDLLVRAGGSKCEQ
jgi:hypothetical protein